MHQKQTGILLLNLGSPDSTQVPDVKKYLDEFLMDKRVIDIPYLLRLFLVKGIITPKRAKESAKAYESIWTADGSPLIINTKKLQAKLQSLIDLPIAIAMRYQNPTTESAFQELLQANPNLEQVLVVPLYPHYAMSSYETAVIHVKESFKKGNYNLQLSFVEPFYQHPQYINSLANSIQPYLQNGFDHLLFSYHGVPERHIKKGDVTHTHCLQQANCCSVPSIAHKYCYKHQCISTTKLVVQQLGLEPHQYSISYQSRLDNKWLEPFTDKRLEAMPSEGIKNLLVICPAFVSDCLETLEEIAERGKDIFLEAGGTNFTMIPCLNDNDDWAAALKDITLQHI